MTFTNQIKADSRVKAYNNLYLDHPFLKELLRGTLDKSKFHNYLIQDSLYLKDYAKVYAHVFLLTDDTEDLQFLHECIGVIVADETNMHKRYLNKHGLTFEAIDKMNIESENRAYLDYMLGFASTGDLRKIFVSALPCTLTYEYIGKALKEAAGNRLADNYYGEWIETYGGKGFEEFSIKSCTFIDKLCLDLSPGEREELIDIYLTACEHELNFWDMSFREVEE